MDDPTLLHYTESTSLHAEQQEELTLHLWRKTAAWSDEDPIDVHLSQQEMQALRQYLLRGGLTLEDMGTEEMALTLREAGYRVSQVPHAPAPPGGLSLDEMATILSASGYLVALEHADLEKLMRRLAEQYGYQLSRGFAMDAAHKAGQPAETVLDHCAAQLCKARGIPELPSDAHRQLCADLSRHHIPRLSPYDAWKETLAARDPRFPVVEG